MTIKIAHLVYSYGTGGLESVIANLINHTETEHIQHVIITQKPEFSFASALKFDIPMYSLNKKEGKDFASHIRLFKLLRKIKPDIFHTYNFGTIEYHPIAKLAGVKRLIHAEHGREDSYKTISNPQKYILFRRAMLPFLDYFVVVSNDLHDWSEQQLRVTKKKLKLIYNGIDLNRFCRQEAGSESKGKTCQLKPNGNKGFTFITVGRLVDVKNHKFLIDAFKLATEQSDALTNATLNIVGDGPNRADLQKQIDCCGLSEQVTLLGNRTDIAELLLQSDIFVLSSKYEAQPMTALEAMACQLPVIAPDVGGLGFLIEDGKNGKLVKPNDTQSMVDALIGLAQQFDTVKEYGKAGRALVEKHFSVKAMSNQYLSLYGETNTFQAE
jgi:sugar transferase (PEP-CTERM/EpsH1 system associated)